MPHIQANTPNAQDAIHKALADGELVNVVGPAASGKTTIALTMVREANGNGVAAVIIPCAKTTLARVVSAIPAARPLLVIVEEADRLAVDDQAKLVGLLLELRDCQAILVSQRPLPVPLTASVAR